jgi:myo-inositol-1(or 4)-monophosphatase
MAGLNPVGGPGGATLLRKVAACVRHIAHEEIMPRYQKVGHSRKSDGSLLTEADVATQMALTRWLRDLVDCPVLGEEMSEEEQHRLWGASDITLWCVDPIDGTSNFIKGLPCFAVSVALIAGGKPVLGAIYNPVSDELFTAVKGQGALLNGARLETHQTPRSLKRCVAGIDFKRLPRSLAGLLAATPPYSSQRNFGSSALDWCFLAANRYDVYAHGGQKVWDYSAGVLILEEAGGALCTFEQEDFWQDDVWCRPVVAASNAALLQAWRAWLRRNL